MSSRSRVVPAKTAEWKCSTGRPSLPPKAGTGFPAFATANTGIWQDVTLTATGPVEIGDLNVITTLPKPDRSEADIEIEAPLTNSASAAMDGELSASFDDVKVTKHVNLDPGETVVRLEPAELCAPQSSAS